jgi:hypothetical protein
MLVVVIFLVVVLIRNVWLSLIVCCLAKLLRSIALKVKINGFKLSPYKVLRLTHWLYTFIIIMLWPINDCTDRPSRHFIGWALGEQGL